MYYKTGNPNDIYILDCDTSLCCKDFYSPLLSKLFACCSSEKVQRMMIIQQVEFFTSSNKSRLKCLITFKCDNDH